MKNTIKFLFILFYIHSNAQNVELYGDSTEISIDGKFQGNIQWQSSKDSVNWFDLIDEDNSVLKLIITDDTFFRAKFTEVNRCDWYSPTKKITFDKSKKVYGVRIDRNKITENSIERIYNSVDKKAYAQVEGEDLPAKDEFNEAFPFNQMKMCNLKSQANSQMRIVYSNEDGFTRSEDTFIEIPLFYMKRFFQNNFDYRLISQTQHDGFYPAPMFVEDGKILDKVYIAVYETSIDDNGIARSVTAKLPTTEKTITEFRNLYLQKGNGFSQMDIRTIMSLQHLYLVCYANKNSQELIGGGWSNLIQPTLKIEKSGFTDEIVIKEDASVADWYWFKNQNVCVVNKDNKTIYKYAKLRDYKKDTPKQSYTTLYLDRYLNVDTTMYFGSSAQNTGWTDNIIHRTGRSIQKTTRTNNEACSVKLFGIENLWGNVWEFVDGLVFDDSVPYIGFNTKTYNDDAKGYTAMDYKCLVQVENHPMNATFGFVDNLGIEPNYNWLAFPDQIGGSVKNKGYGDFYYHINSKKITSVFGGGFDNYSRNGLFTLRNWQPKSMKWYLYGSRMQFKPIY